MLNTSDISNRKYRVTFPDADFNLSTRCIMQAEKIYGSPLPDMVKERLGLELPAIMSHGHASQYLIGAMIADEASKKGTPLTTRGMIGSAFVSYLCGISKVNPLPAHRYCPKCHHFESVTLEDGAMSYDLPDKICPHCGSILITDGADIYPEILMGGNLDREPDIIFNVPAEIREELVEYIKTTFGVDNVFRAGTKVEREDGSIRRNMHPGGIFIVPDNADITEYTSLREELPDDGINLRITEEDYHDLQGSFKKYDLLVLQEFSILRRLEKVTGFMSDRIKTNDKELIDVFMNEGLSFFSRPPYYAWSDCIQKKSIKAASPHTFSDLVRITALMHGVGALNDTTEILIKEGKPLHELISCRDDIMQYLINIGFERKRAFEIMNRVRKGKGLTKDMIEDMKEAGVPDWYIESCNKIKYLFPKSHAVEYMLLYWKLAYYKLHFPKECKETVSMVKKCGIKGTATGFKVFDHYMSGLQPSDLILIAARPSMGKTTFVMNIVRHICYEEKLKAAFFSTDMNKENLIRCLSSMKPYIYEETVYRDVKEGKKAESITCGMDSPETHGLIIDNATGISMEELFNRCRKYHGELNLSLIVIDYLYPMIENRQDESDNYTISEMMHSLKVLAGEILVPIIVIAQLSRRIDTRKDHRPRLSDLRGSGISEEDTDAVLFLYRDDYYNLDSSKKEVIEVTIAKNKRGPIGTAELAWVPGGMEYIDL